MKYLKISNKGVLNMKLVALMGGTTKAGNQFKIGTYGTGLKYTLAFLLRNNIDFHIFCGNEECKVSTVKETIQETDFEIIHINGERTSITTEMGKDWQTWMIIRELWSNALDEGEAFKETTEVIEGKEGYTTYYIQITQEVKDVIMNWKNYFIHTETPISDNETHAIYSGGDSLRIYKNGILIHEDKKEIALFSYDIKQATLNELREFKGYLTYEIVTALSKANSKAITHFLENVTDDYYEGSNLNYDMYVNFAETWRDTIGNAKLIHQKSIDNMKAKEIDVDTAGMIIVPEKVYKFLTKQFDGIGALRTADKLNEFYEIHDEALDLMIKSALAVLETCEYFISPELKFIYGIFGNKTILAQIHMDEKTIYVSESMRNKSQFEVIAMIIEENEHFNTHFQDCSRNFQQFWINLYTTQLLKAHSILL